MNADMNADTAAKKSHELVVSDRCTGVESIAEWMRWNDITSSPARLRPSLDLSETIDSVQGGTKPDPAADER